MHTVTPEHPRLRVIEKATTPKLKLFQIPNNKETMGQDQIRALDHLLGENPAGVAILIKKWPVGLGKLLSIAYGVFCLIKTFNKNNPTIMSGESLSQLKGAAKIGDKNPYWQAMNEIFKLRPFIVYKPLLDKSALAALSETLQIDTSRAITTHLNGNSTVVILGEINERPAVVHYGQTIKAKKSIQRHNRGLQIAEKWAINTKHNTRPPKIIDYVDAPNFCQLAQARIQGKTGVHANTPENEFQKRIGNMIDFAASLSETPIQKTISKNFLEETIASLRSELSTEHLSQIASILNVIENWSRGFIQTPTLIHGDLWLNNGLFDESGNLTGVIDWEWANENGFILYDAMHCLLISTAAHRGSSAISIIQKIWRDDIKDEWLIKTLDNLKARFKASTNDQKFVAAAIWLIIIKRTHIDTGPASEIWLRRHITEPARIFSEFLSYRKSTEHSDGLAGIPWLE